MSCYLQCYIQVWETGMNWDRQSSSALARAQASGGFNSSTKHSSFLCCSFSALHQQCYELPTSPCSLATSHFLFIFLRQTLFSHTPTAERTPISLDSSPKITSQLSLCGLPLQLWVLNWLCCSKHLLHLCGQLWDLHPGQAIYRQTNQEPLRSLTINWKTTPVFHTY